MTKKEFMEKLHDLISDLSYSEKKEIFNYYEEYFEELGLNDYDEIPKNMDPQTIAKEILLEFNINRINKKERISKPLTTIFLILGTLFSAPIAIPLLFVIMLVLFILFTIFGSLFMSVLTAILGLILLPFKFLSNLIFNYSIYSSSYTNIAIILIIIGIILSFYAIISTIFKMIFLVISTIFTNIYMLFSTKNIGKKNYNANLDELKEIAISDFPGKVIIRKSYTNDYELKNSSNLHIYPEYNNGILSIHSKKGIYAHLANIELIIRYKDDKVNMNIKDVMGKINIDLPKKANINIKDILGKITLNLYNGDNINLYTKDILGRINVNENIRLENNSDLNIEIKDVLGSIYIEDVR